MSEENTHKILESKLTSLDNGGNSPSLAETYRQEDMRIKRIDYSIFQIHNLYRKTRTLRIAPDFQHEKRWDDKDKSKLIESILMGIPLPSIYVFETMDGIREVVDGTKRISAIMNFLNNEFTLKGLDILYKYNGDTFDSLPARLRAYIEDFQLSFYVVQPPTPEGIKYEIFKRINKGVSEPSKQELRHMLYSGKVTEAVHTIATSSIFKKATGWTSRKHFLAEEFVLRVLAFTLYFKKRFTPYLYDYNGDLDTFLAWSMQQVNSGRVDDLESTLDEIIEALHTSLRLFGPDVFRFQKEGKSKSVNQDVLFESIIYFLTLPETKKAQTDDLLFLIDIYKKILMTGDAYKKNKDSVLHVQARFTGLQNALNEMTHDS